MTTVVAFPRGSGKTLGVLYHLSHMVARCGWRVLTADLDPEAKLTATFFGDDELEGFWEGNGADTMATAVEPLVGGNGDVRVPVPQEVSDRLWVLPSDPALGRFEGRLSTAWPVNVQPDDGSLRVTTAFHRIVQGCAARVSAHVVFIDVGSYLGAITRSALLASDALIVPLEADLFSVHALRNLGPALRAWRSEWQQAVLPHASGEAPPPCGAMRPLGYVLLQQGVRLDRPVKAYDRMVVREFHRSILGEREAPIDDDADPYQLARLRAYRVLMALSEEARKPMFDLQAADGALGSTGRLVQTCYGEFQRLAARLMDAVGIPAASMM